MRILVFLGGWFNRSRSSLTHPFLPGSEINKRKIDVTCQMVCRELKYLISICLNYENEAQVNARHSLVTREVHFTVKPIQLYQSSVKINK